MMNRLPTLLLLTFCLASVMSCKKDDADPYPSIVTQFANIYSNEQGELYKFTTDEEQTYTIASPIGGYNKNRIYRGMCGYVPEGGTARLYQLAPVYILRDSTRQKRQDATDAYSVWMTKHYINMQLKPLTQGGNHYWGFNVDSVRGKTEHLSL